MLAMDPGHLTEFTHILEASDITLDVDLKNKIDILTEKNIV